MTKKNQKSPPSYKSSYLIIILVIAAVLAVFFVSRLFPQRVPVSYFVKVLDAIGTPEGFEVDHTKDRVSSSAFEHEYARRAYSGGSTFEMVKAEMTTRFEQAGFKNVIWREGTERNVDGLLAACKGVYVFARIYQEHNTNPIDIEVSEGTYDGAPTCPAL